MNYRRELLVKVSKFFLSIVLLSLFQIGGTNSLFVDKEIAENNFFSAGCWAGPTAPELVSPENETYARLGSDWETNPVMDWEDSYHQCPSESPIEYQYESYRDEDLTQLAYRSSWRTDSFIPAPSTPDGVYFWRVRARDENGESDFSEVWKLVVDRTAPVTPTGLRILDHEGNDLGCGGTTDNRHITVDWDDNTEPDLAYYQYDIKDQDDFRRPTISQYSGMIRDEDGLYKYRVSAVDAAGNKSPATDWCQVRLDRSVDEPTVNPGDVVINEVMWMGSEESTADEWIELRNMTDEPIYLKHWSIENARSSGQPALKINSSEIIPAHGYLLIANYAKNSANSHLNVSVDVVNSSMSLLEVNNGHLILKDGDGNVIDQAKGDSWPAGKKDGAIRRSMERNDTPSDGLLASSWHTCEDEACNDTTYWDSESNTYGTPGAENLSDNDLSLQTDLDFNLTGGGKQVAYRLFGKGLELFSTYEYVIEYDSDQGLQRIEGKKEVLTNDIRSGNLDLGTCSKNVCSYHTGIDKVHLFITLDGAFTRKLERELDL